MCNNRFCADSSWVIVLILILIFCGGSNGCCNFGCDNNCGCNNCCN